MRRAKPEQIKSVYRLQSGLSPRVGERGERGGGGGNIIFLTHLPSSVVASDLFRRLFWRITVSKSVLTTLELVLSTLRELSN